MLILQQISKFKSINWSNVLNQEFKHDWSNMDTFQCICAYNKFTLKCVNFCWLKHCEPWSFGKLECLFIWNRKIIYLYC